MSLGAFPPDPESIYNPMISRQTPRGQLQPQRREPQSNPPLLAHSQTRTLEGATGHGGRWDAAADPDGVQRHPARTEDAPNRPDHACKRTPRLGTARAADPADPPQEPPQPAPPTPTAPGLQPHGRFTPPPTHQAPPGLVARPKQGAHPVSGKRTRLVKLTVEARPSI